MQFRSGRPGVLLITGNGLTLDLCYGHGADQLRGWNTQAPLDWPVMTPGEPGVSLRARLPWFDSAVRELSGSTPKPTDFEVIDLIARRLMTDPDDRAAFYRVVEMNHYLALAYSTFQVAADQVDLEGWRWVEYLRTVGRRLVGAFSFNYDLVLESALETAGTPYHRLGLGHGDDRALVVKPHGSIDYELGGILMPVGYPVTNFFHRTNSPLEQIPRDDLLRARKGPELVAPMQTSEARHYQWVARGFNDFREKCAPLVGSCVLVGTSYWPADRPEIDEIFDGLLPQTEIVVANPTPSQDLLDAIRIRGFNPIVAKGPTSTANVPTAVRPARWPYPGSASTPTGSDRVNGAP